MTSHEASGMTSNEASGMTSNEASGMTSNIIIKKYSPCCYHDECQEKACYNSIGSINPKYCPLHKSPSMINVYSSFRFVLSKINNQ